LHRPFSHEQRDREHDVIFGQLGFFAYNMVSFGLAEEAVRGLLEKYARFVHLDDTQWALLVANLEAFCTEHRRQTAAETKARAGRQLAAASAGGAPSAPRAAGGAAQPPTATSAARGQVQVPVPSGAALA
jgi:hypothetical protein